MRSKAVQSLALRPPTSQRGHVGSDPGFVDEDEPLGIEAILPSLPARSSPGNVDAALLKRKYFFEAQAFPAHELPDRIVGNRHAANRQFVLQTVQRQMRGLLDPLDDEGAVRLQNPPTMPAHLAGRDAPRRPITLRPLHH